MFGKLCILYSESYRNVPSNKSYLCTVRHTFRKKNANSVGKELLWENIKDLYHIYIHMRGE